MRTALQPIQRRVLEARRKDLVRLGVSLYIRSFSVKINREVHIITAGSLQSTKREIVQAALKELVLSECSEDELPYINSVINDMPARELWYFFYEYFGRALGKEYLVRS